MMKLFVATFDPKTFERLLGMFEDCAPGGSSGVNGGRLLWLFTDYDASVHDQMLRYGLAQEIDVKWGAVDDNMTISDCINKLYPPNT